MPLNNKQFQSIVSNVQPYIQRHGPAVGLIAVLECCKREGLYDEAALIQGVCEKIGVAFQNQYVTSRSNPNERYKVVRTPNGDLTCECKGWIFCRIYELDGVTPLIENGAPKKKQCSHTRVAESRPDAWRDVITLPSQTLAEAKLGDQPGPKKKKKSAPAATHVQSALVPSFIARAIVFDDDE